MKLIFRGLSKTGLTVPHIEILAVEIRGRPGSDPVPIANEGDGNPGQTQSPRYCGMIAPRTGV